MAIRHNNINQIVKPVSFLPLLKNESPYYNNLNRGPKNAYDYADSVNKVLSYGGCVSRLKPASSASVFNLYNIVKIDDGESISIIADASALNNYDRFGIIVTEKDDEGYYIVCTFCPNFVYPYEVCNFNAGDFGDNLRIDLNITPHNTTLAANSNVIIGRVTGQTSIFFCGTTRLFT